MIDLHIVVHFHIFHSDNHYVHTWILIITILLPLGFLGFYWYILQKCSEHSKEDMWRYVTLSWTALIFSFWTILQCLGTIRHLASVDICDMYLCSNYLTEKPPYITRNYLRPIFQSWKNKVPIDKGDCYFNGRDI